MSATEWAGVGEHRDKIGIAVVEHSMHSLIVEPPCGSWLHIQFFDVMQNLVLFHVICHVDFWSDVCHAEPSTRSDLEWYLVTLVVGRDAGGHAIDMPIDFLAVRHQRDQVKCSRRALPGMPGEAVMDEAVAGCR